MGSLSSGVFIDSAVSGVHYNDSLTGLDGRFFYISGELLHFHLGAIELGTVSGRAQITPFDLAGSYNDYEHDLAIRMARLLQSLDGNGVLSDGIQISDSVRNAAASTSLNWKLPAADFEQALADTVFRLTGGQATVVSAEAASAHLFDTMSNTVEACGSLPDNAAHFSISNPRCLDRARMAAWLEDVKPRELNIDVAISSFVAGGSAIESIDLLVALVPSGVSGASYDGLQMLASWVAERVSGDDSDLRYLLTSYLARKYVGRALGESACPDSCNQPTLSTVATSMNAMRARTTAAQWQRTLNEAAITRSVVASWLSFGFDRAALLSNLGVSSLRDRGPLLRAAAASLGLGDAQYRVDLVDGWVAEQLALNDIALTARGSFASDVPASGDTGEAQVSEVTHSELVIGQAATFEVFGNRLGASLVFTLSGCQASPVEGGSASLRAFTCVLTGDSGLRTVTVTDGLSNETLYRLSVFVDAQSSAVVPPPSDGDDSGSGGTAPPDDQQSFAVTAISPDSARIGEATTFTLSGRGFTAETAVEISLCGAATVVSRTGTQIRFNCTPAGQAGNRAVTVTQGAERHDSLRVTFEHAAPTIATLTPLTATQDEATTFTVTGAKLSADMTFTLEGCTGVSTVAGGTEEARAYRCTPASAGSKAGTITLAGSVVHEFTVVVDAAAEPVVTAVSPESGVMSSPLSLTVTGTDLPDDLLLSLTNCDGLSATSRSSTVQEFTCQPGAAGVLAGNVSVDGDILATFSVEIRDDRVMIDSVRPISTRLDAITTFTVSGSALPASLTLDVASCLDLQPLGGDSTRRQFRCTPVGAVGSRDVHVMLDADSTQPLFTHTLIVAGDGPLISDVSPTSTVVGRLVTFTVLGQSLNLPLSLRMEGCEAIAVGTPSASLHRFRCTITGVAGTRTASIVNTRTGEVLYAFDMDIDSAT